MPITLKDTDATLIDKRWQEQADQLASQGLPQIRATASAWTVTIGALSSLLGLSLVLKGRGDLAGLAPGTGVTVGILSLIALVLAISAVYLGALAAQGTPTSLWDSGPKLKQWSMTQASLASSRLRLSRILILVSLLFLILSIAVDWYGPAAAGPLKPQVLVVSKRYGLACGQLIADGRSIIVKPSDTSKPTLRMDSSDVLSASPVQQCP